MAGRPRTARGLAMSLRGTHSLGRFSRPGEPITMVAPSPFARLVNGRSDLVTEKGESPIKKASQRPDKQNKTTIERVKKQDVTKEETGKPGAGDFIKGTIHPEKEG